MFLMKFQQFFLSCSILICFRSNRISFFVFPGISSSGISMTSIIKSACFLRCRRKRPGRREPGVSAPAFFYLHDRIKQHRVYTAVVDREACPMRVPVPADTADISGYGSSGSFGMPEIIFPHHNGYCF